MFTDTCTKGSAMTINGSFMSVYVFVIPVVYSMVAV
jgi:hypothetical protein